MPKYAENLKKRKPTGGVRVPNRGRRAYEQHGYPVETRIGEEERFLKKGKGGNYKVKCVMASYANVVDHVSKQTRKVKILKFITNPASKDLTRRGIITKGAILDTELGQVKVTSRPGQDGVVNAVLVKR
ncbi:MAG: 30S ribosomal protein S8e [Nitrososphaeria archaeon]|nr:30S ribosomal protein S8e [Nitrososphaeria archaeon]